MSSYGLMNLEDQKEKIDRLVFEVGFFYLNNVSLRAKFMAEENSIALGYINDYVRGEYNFSQAMEKLHNQYEMLSTSHTQLQMGTLKLYAIAEREKERHSFLTITLKRVGFISGVMQFIGGSGLCKASLGAACKSFGVPLMIQGAENTWENGYYLLYHEAPQKMPLRYAYRYAANILGGDDKNADIAFSSGDLVLSLGSASVLTLRTDAWKLFHYIREYYIENWKTLGAIGGLNEVTGDALSGLSIYQLTGDTGTNWADLGK
ncbi:DUF4225 domain-containing protein [Atlantibacter subterraneus]|uniref:DUF4225 domain-containing protein n=1 Tax=Atlantibacter subterraneus TaxID=255519 RepID=UPI0028999318|nr:DUF4225 domain-containing protein [Atlantibacter subterranea]